MTTAKPDATVAAEPATPASDATSAGASPAAKPAKGKAKAATTAPKLPKAVAKRADEAVPSVASVTDTVAPTDAGETTPLPTPASPKPTKMVSGAKTKAVKVTPPKATASKAKRGSPVEPQTEQTPARGKRGQPKADRAPPAE